jgi:hypothetical protein
MSVYTEPPCCSCTRYSFFLGLFKTQWLKVPPKKTRDHSPSVSISGTNFCTINGNPRSNGKVTSPGRLESARNVLRAPAENVGWIENTDAKTCQRIDPIPKLIRLLVIIPGRTDHHGVVFSPVHVGGVPDNRLGNNSQLREPRRN